jgi:hypothetical protein
MSSGVAAWGPFFLDDEGSKTASTQGHTYKARKRGTFRISKNDADGSENHSEDKFDMLMSSYLYSPFQPTLIHTTIGCGEQGFPSAHSYLSHTSDGGASQSPGLA